MSASEAKIRRARKDGGPPQFHSWLEPEHGTVFGTVICRTLSRGPITNDSLGIQRATPIVREECGNNPDRAFKNEYDTCRHGTSWKSGQ